VKDGKAIEGVNFRKENISRYSRYSRYISNI